MIRYLKQLKWKIQNFYNVYMTDRQFGIDTMNSYDLPMIVSQNNDVKGYSSTLYSEIYRMMDYLKLNRNDVFVDFGCGKGRVVFQVASQKLKKVVGVELNSELMSVAKQNLKNIKINQTPIEFFNGDAIDFDVSEGTVFYLFNPFGEETLKKVLKNISDSQTVNKRPIRIVYRNPVYKNILNALDWLEPEGPIANTEMLVWHNK